MNGRGWRQGGKGWMKERSESKEGRGGWRRKRMEGRERL